MVLAVVIVCAAWPSRWMFSLDLSCEISPDVRFESAFRCRVVLAKSFVLTMVMNTWLDLSSLMTA